MAMSGKEAKVGLMQILILNKKSRNSFILCRCLEMFDYHYLQYDHELSQTSGGRKNNKRDLRFTLIKLDF